MINDSIVITGASDKAGAGSCKSRGRGLIINPGALGDVILTLPLAEFMLKALNLISVDIMGRRQYVEFIPHRTSVSAIGDIDAVDFHRLFVSETDFRIEEAELLVSAFSGYEWIVSFLAEKESDFEKNLICTIFSANCAEISILPMHPLEGERIHISEFYIKQFIGENDFEVPDFNLNLKSDLIRPLGTDIEWGKQLMGFSGVKPDSKTVVIQPGSGGKYKCWHIDNFCSVAVSLGEDGFEPVILLGPAEAERFSDSEKQRLGSVGKVISSLNIKQATQLIAASGAYIGNDSGTTHLAAGMGCKTAAIFGPTDANVYGPFGSRTAVIQAGGESFAQSDEKSQLEVKEAINLLLND